MRVLIADDHPLYLDAVRTLLERLFPSSQVVEARALPETLLTLREQEPFEIVLADYCMPGMRGVVGVRDLVGSTTAPVLVMSGVATREEVDGFIAAGAKGFLPKTLNGPVFAAAVHMILVGGTFVPAEFAGLGERKPESPSNGSGELSVRELDVLELMVDGASNKEIARSLAIQEVTVKLHATRIFGKLGVRNRAQAAVKALEHRLIQR